MLKGFKKFVLRGSVLDLAVGVVIGSAFGATINSLVTDIITPLIGIIFGTPDFSALKLGALNIGKFINAVVSFLLVALTLYFVVIAPMNIRKQGLEAAPAAPPEEVMLLREIRDALKK
jgi:large conductance mechanosensitive channel